MFAITLPYLSWSIHSKWLPALHDNKYGNQFGSSMSGSYDTPLNSDP